MVFERKSMLYEEGHFEQKNKVGGGASDQKSHIVMQLFR